MRDILKEGWVDAKTVLTEGLTGHKKATMEVLLETQRKALLENASAVSTSASHIATLNKVMLPIIRRVYPGLIANEIVGVQPMTGPVGQISTLRVRYAESVGGVNGVTAGTEALSPFDIARFYSGNEDPANPAAAETTVLEGRKGRAVNVQIVKDTVTAKTRRLSATWSFEASQDAQAQYGIDLEQETLAAVAQEIVTEIDQEILLNLRRLPGAPTAVYDQSAVSGVATFVGDEHAAFATLINRLSNLIASRTRRGPANWLVVSPAMLSVLQSARTSAFARTTEGTFGAATNTQLVGTLNNSIKVYLDSYASDTEVALLGYKGNDTDAALYYCPYQMLMNTPVVLDPDTFTPTVGFMTRYGIKTLTDTSSSLGNSADYLATIAPQNLRFI